MKLPKRARTMLRWTAVWLPLVLIAWMFDRAVYRLALDPLAASKDWVQVLRQMGYLPTWIVVGVLFWLIDFRSPPRAHGLVSPAPDRPWHHRGGLVMLSAISAGLVANVLKPLLGRLRPDLDGVAYFAHRPTTVWADGGDLGFGLPSGHTSVAFGACGMIALLVPAWRIPMMGLAAGCAMTRLLAGAHTFSDTVAGAWVGLAVAAWLFAWGEGKRRGIAGGLIPREA